MNENMSIEPDPLCTYDYSYGNYENIQMNQPYYPYNIKLEPSQTELMNLGPDLVNNYPYNMDNPSMPVRNTADHNLLDLNNSDERKRNRRVKKEKGKTSSYWSTKIKDDNFKFYGCSVCNISFFILHELDAHVTTHKDRLTSYHYKLNNRNKRNKNMKMKKMLKNIKTEIDIKPEEGYIGTEEASKYEDVINSFIDNGNLAMNLMNSENASTDTAKNVNKSETNNSNEGKEKKIEQDSIEKTNLEKIYKCFGCQKQFSLSYYLKLHVRSHTDEKPYQCSQCGESFITASKLGRHNKRVHLAIRYQCRICFKVFTKFDQLTKHFDKLHESDKLEGEPYDYNAILPYLKQELEDQLPEKNVIEETALENNQLINENDQFLSQSNQLLNENNLPIQENNEAVRSNLKLLNDNSEDVCKMEDSWDNQGFDDNPDDNEHGTVVNMCNIVVEEIKVDNNEADNKSVEVKIETDVSVDIKSEDVKEDVKDEDASDDDYFPSNTWATTPKVEPIQSPPSPESKKSTLQCDICQKMIRSAYYMKVHMRTHTGEKPFKCYICNRGFITSSKMHRHVLTHSESWEGDEDIKQEMDVKIEEEDGNEKKKVNKDSIKKAKAQFSKKKYARNQKRPHACEFCQKRFLHKETLNVHRKSHEGEEMVLKCYYCLVKADDDESLKTHQATHEGPRPFLCTICGKTYKKRETMIYHRKHHKPLKEYVCDICSKTFSAPCKLQRHIVSHKVDKFVLRYECPVCAHMFNTKYHIQMHLTTHQKEGLIMEENRSEILAMVLQNARKIPKQSSTSSQQVITDQIPSDERSRVCNICGEVFQHFYYLEEHLKSHGSRIAIEDDNAIEERKHKCTECGKGFKLHYYLKLHSFTHTKEKPYICQQCGKGFITKGKLKRHLETHTGLKKYQCHICYKFFTRPSYRRIHVRTIHGNQDYNFRGGKEYGVVAPFSLPMGSV